MSDLLWKPDKSVYSNSAIKNFSDIINNRYGISFDKYEDLWQWSIKEPQKFWSALIQSLDIHCSGQIDPVITKDELIYDQIFFPNISLNYAENIILNLNSTPIIFINEKGFRQEISKEEIITKVSRLSSYLRSIGIRKGDRVAAIAANTPNTLISFLAVNTIGAIWSSCSPDFGEAAILDRFNQIEPRVLLYSEIYFYGGKKFNIRDKVSNVINEMKTLKKSLCINYQDEKEEDIGKDIIDINSIFNDENLSEELVFETCSFNDPMYILYSSGTTGKPKCIIHNVGGPLIQHMKEHQLHCNLKPNEKIFYFTTCGWMMWNWLVSALASKAIIILYDGSPFFPDKESILKMVDSEKINCLGVSAKYIDALRNEEFSAIDRCNLDSLKCILSTGSPLIKESFEYVYRNLKKDVHLASISGGTDIVSCFVLGNPNMPVFSGEIQCKSLGVDVDVFDENGKSTRDKGELVCKSAIPSMPIGFWNDNKKTKYISSYFSRFENVWTQGDFANITDRDGMIIYGRSDATLNPGGIRIGTAEIYRAVETLDAVAESIAVSQEWGSDIRIILFVKLKPMEELTKELIRTIKDRIRVCTSIRHVPAKVIRIMDIPKTKSGKIVELSVRDIINGKKPKNVGVLENPECLSEYENIEELKE